MECKVVCGSLPWEHVNVLIETLWNVKLTEQEVKVIVSSINRNIVECKVSLSSFWQFWIDVLIETLWNVKTLFGEE